jgi:hypothetical protein
LSVDPDERTWSSDLRVLLERHPRASWISRGTPTARFWLDVHDEFRRECVALTIAADDGREGRLRAHELAVVARPRVRGLVVNLHGHHEIEDHHYFPTLRDADRRFAADFDLLAADHALIDRHVALAVTALDALVGAADAPAAEAAAARHAAERYAREIGELCRRLVRHLSDEEDLIIPLLLERGV